MRRATFRVLGVTLLAAAVGVATWLIQGRRSTPSTDDLAARFAKYEAAPEPNGDLDKVVWPGYLRKAGAAVKKLYEFQVTHGELMRYMPCYCGCGQHAQHRSNRDCYIRRVNADGSVVFDPMAPT